MSNNFKFSAVYSDFGKKRESPTSYVLEHSSGDEEAQAICSPTGNCKTFSIVRLKQIHGMFLRHSRDQEEAMFYFLIFMKLCSLAIYKNILLSDLVLGTKTGSVFDPVTICLNDFEEIEVNKPLFGKSPNYIMEECSIIINSLFLKKSKILRMYSHENTNSVLGVFLTNLSNLFEDTISEDFEYHIKNNFPSDISKLPIDKVGTLVEEYYYFLDGNTNPVEFFKKVPTSSMYVAFFALPKGERDNIVDKLKKEKIWQNIVNVAEPLSPEEYEHYLQQQLASSVCIQEM